ncbi:glycosyltransferase family 39 protein [Candidatus Altiarchaeota archaeon]
MEHPIDTRRQIMERKGLIALIFAAFISRAYSLYATRGYIHPDNLYQILEPAHRFVYGYGVVTWEFVYGMRSWMQPLLTAMIFRAGLMAGLDDIGQLIFLNRGLMTLFSLGLLYVIYKSGCVMYGRKTGEYALFFAVFSTVLYSWSADTSSTIPATLFSTLAAFLTYKGIKYGGLRDTLLGGMSLGVAFMFRFDSMLFLIPLSAFLLLKKDVRVMASFGTGLAAMIFIQGALDYFTWGSFLHSPIAFVWNNLYLGKSSLFGTESPLFYTIVFAFHISCLFLISYAMEKRYETAYVSSLILFFLGVYTMLPHKELRFITPILPFLFIIAGRGFEKAVTFHGDRVKHIIIILTIAQFLIISADFQWFFNVDSFKATRYVGAREDSVGMAYTMKWFDAGLYTYLNKRIPAVFIADRTWDPLMEPVNCSKVDMDHIGYQCSPLADVLAEENINYVVSAKISRKNFLERFEEKERFGKFIVYKRIT